MLYLFCVWNQNGGGTRLFFKIGICSAKPFQRSRRELSTDVTEDVVYVKNLPKYLLPPF